MPARNRVKTYVENGYYHVYNRGVEKRKIFLDTQDYSVFLHLLKRYLSPPPPEPVHPLSEVTDFHPIRLRPLQTFERDIKLLAYCLLPNHFHLLLFQQPKDGVQRFMHALLLTYAMYFNKRYGRVGRLFQDIFKAAWVGEGNAGDTYLLHLSRYIHLNPKFELTRHSPVNWPYSSYQYYLGKKAAEWIHPEIVLDYFAGPDKVSRGQVALSYQRFVAQDQEILEGFDRLLLE